MLRFRRRAADLDEHQRPDATFPALRTIMVTCSDRVVVSFLRAFAAPSSSSTETAYQWLGLRRLDISTAPQGSLPVNSYALHAVFALVLDALR